MHEYYVHVKSHRCRIQKVHFETDWHVQTKYDFLLLVTILADCFHGFDPDHYTVSIGFIASTPPGTQVSNTDDSPDDCSGSHCKTGKSSWASHSSAQVYKL